jgi:hypothetical protein
MVKKCIICGEPAGSKEHLFPASFGAMRTNKGIYCGAHNEAFGKTHVTALLHRLEAINALIGVVPDGKDEVRPATGVGADGDRYLFSTDGIKLAPPAQLLETPELVGKETVFRFADRKQADEWLAQQRKNFIVEVRTMALPASKIVRQPIGASRELGDEPFMRALLYIGLTFLAHSYPDVARSPGVKAARDIVENDSEVGHRVWWVRSHVLTQLPANPFAYGHTVAIALRPQDAKVVGLICLYGLVQVGMELGTYADPAEHRYVMQIDPIAQRQPQDIIEGREEGMSLFLDTPEEGRHYAAAIRAGTVENPFDGLVREALRRPVQQMCQQLLSIFLAVKENVSTDRVRDALSTYDQQVYNQLYVLVKDFDPTRHGLPPFARNMLEHLLAGDASSSRGLAFQSEAALRLATAALADDIVARMNAGELDLAYLESVLGERHGVDVIESWIVKPLKSAIDDAIRISSERRRRDRFGAP